MKKQWPIFVTGLLLLSIAGLGFCSLISFAGIGDTSLTPSCEWETGRSDCRIACERGTLKFSLSGPYPRKGWRDPAALCTITGFDVVWYLPGVTWYETRYQYVSIADGTFTTTYHQFGMWSVYALALLTLPLVFPARQYWKHRVLVKRRERGECIRCGYDLRASGERCPECGARRDYDGN